MPVAAAYGSLPFVEQIEFFRRKLNLPTDGWTDVRLHEHDWAFVVAGANRDAIVSDFRAAVEKAIAGGSTLEDFRKDFDRIVATHGWDYNGGRNWRSRVIYDTNLATSYAAGRWQQLQAAPYWQYDHQDWVENPRPQHVSWDGLVLERENPFWQTHFPPNGWGCNCKVRGRWLSDLVRMGKSGPDQAPQFNYVERTIGQRSALGPRTVRVPEGIDPGFDPRQVLAFATSVTSDTTATPDQLRAKYREAERQFKSVPGVESVAMIGGSLPMTGDSEVPFWLEGATPPANQNDMTFALFYLVTPQYAQAMRIPLQRGRFLSDRDDEHSPVTAVIDAAFASKYFPNVDPVGKRLNIGLLDMKAEIVGVVGHVEHWGLGDKKHETLQAQLYLSVWQVPDRFWTLLSSGSGYVARTTTSPLGVMGAIREAAARADASSVVYGARPMEEVVANSIATQRLAMIMLSIFSVVALLLSAIGIYGVISYLTGQRTQEIGIRVALGASSGDVQRMVIGEGMRITVVGVVLGIGSALALTRLLATLIYGVGAWDPVTFAGVALLLTGVALFACYIPARRAMRVDPMIALRYE